MPSCVGPHLMPAAVMAMGSTWTLLLAVDLPLAQEMTAMAMVGTFFLWLIRRENRREVRDDSNVQGRLTGLDAEIAALRAEVSEQRHLKHSYINRFAGLRGTLVVTRNAAERCSCGAMEAVLPLLVTVLAEDP
jgi:hypothetical protein